MLRFVRFCALMTLTCTALWLMSGCAATPKLPAGDIDIYTRYAGAISVLHNRKLASNTREKYEAALQIARGVDFSYCREVKTLDKIFGGKHDARLGEYVHDMQLVIFYYQYRTKSVRFVFQRYKNAIVKAEVKIKN
ncbi:hypothetical protein P0136_13465 [Lentisphaerota bacterium ZTH]|nr:hypothetical protein JYG24_09020 [Lentisphaerota bacterium]WET06366.1 hypothetical protein P0136_13465 [Lentisphaerota bacterium ZTH]